MDEQKNYEEKVEPAVAEQRHEPIMQESLPNAGLVLTMGILSIVLACCCGPLGIITGIIGLLKGNSGVAAYKMSPNSYTRSSYSNLNAGRIASIVGLVLAALAIIWTFYSVNQMGGWGAYMETVKEMAEQYQ